MPNNCDHFDAVNIKQPDSYECEECVRKGDRWVHLRTCQTCGKTLCCDSSLNKHASKHFDDTGHPVVIFAEKEENRAWCYKDKIFMVY